MTGTALLSPGVRKEVRALLPIWLGCAAAIVGAALLHRYGGVRGRIASSGPICAYVLGSVSLGALSIGHEYTGRTLTLLLSLPVDRRRLYLVKLGVLIPMLLTLGALALGLLFTPSDPDLAGRVAIPLLSVMCGLFLAPWLTMLCRSPLAGLTFAMAIPGLTHICGVVAGFAIYGFTPDAARVELAVLWWGMTGFCAVAAVSSWRMFMRLEAIDGNDSHVRLPRWLRDRAPASDAGHARQRPVGWLLAKKELRLQHLTFAVSGIYLLAWGALALVRQMAPEFEGVPIGVLTILYGGAVAILTGSLASAEERQFGTLESQVLLPMAAWKQWAVKAGMTVGLTLFLGAAMPALLGYIDQPADSIRVNAWFAGALVLYTVASLYISTLCPSGLRALMASIAVVLFIVIVVPLLLGFLGPAVYRSLHSALTARQYAWLQESIASLAIALAAGFLPLALWFGLVNHRSAERGLGRAWPQFACMAAWLTAAGVLMVL